MTRPPLKLLWIFSSLGRGPAAERFATLAKGLDDSYEHVVAALDGDVSGVGALPESVRWRKLETPRKKRRLLSIGALWNARRMLLEERPHLVLTSNHGALEWLALNRGPGAVPHVHFEDPEGVAPVLDDADPARNWARRRAFPGRERRFVAGSHAVRALFLERWGAPAEQVMMIPQGVDIPAATAVEKAEEGAASVTVGAAGPLIREKRFDRLLRLVASLRARGREARALIIGSGPEKTALESEIATLGLGEHARIQDIADPAPETLPAALLALDLFCVTSDQELAPTELAAAMAAGLPVAATDVGEVRRMLAEEGRLFVRPQADESALVAAAELLVSDPTLRADLGRANRVRAEKASPLAAMVERFDTLFRELCANSSLLMLPAPAPAADEAPRSDAGKTSGDGDAKAAKAPAAEDGSERPKAGGRTLPVATVRPLEAESGVGADAAKRVSGAAPARKRVKKSSEEARTQA